MAPLENGIVPPPAPLRPAQSSAPAAHTSFLPADALQHLAAQTGVSVDAFAHLTVRQSASPLWAAIKSYVSYSPVPPGHKHVPIVVESCALHKDDDAGADMDLAATHAPSFNRRPTMLSFHARRGGRPGGRGVQPPAKPVFSLDTSSVAFVWPPPPHLRAERLLALRDADPARSLHKAVLEAAEASEGAQATDSGAQTTIYLFYYRAGDPVCTGRMVDSMYEMLLASESGVHALMCFAEDVLEWHKKLIGAPDLLARFPLLRFKLDGCGGYWHSEGLKRARPARSVVLPGDLMEHILADVENFTSEATRTWYYQHGLPYRRAFLFFGPPGSGKTSTIRVIASRFMLSCCVLSVANNNFSNQSLGDALSSIPGNSLLVLEDVDALFNENRSNKMENQLTFSGLLNALDGLVSVEGLITVMTTNHIERLERALIRGGRVDRRFKFDLPTDPQLCKLFRSFYPDCEDACVDRFVRAVRGRREGDEARAVSTLQQLFIAMREKSAQQCVEGMDEFFRLHFQDGEGASPSYMI